MNKHDYYDVDWQAKFLFTSFESPSHSCHLRLTKLKKSGYAYSVTIAIAEHTTGKTHFSQLFSLSLNFL